MGLSLENLRRGPLRSHHQRKQYQASNMQDDEDQENVRKEGNQDNEENSFVKDYENY